MHELFKLCFMFAFQPVIQPIMKKIIFPVFLLALFTACGPSAEERAAKEKAQQDSIERAQAAMRAAEQEALRRAEAESAIQEPETDSAAVK